MEQGNLFKFNQQQMTYFKTKQRQLESVNIYYSQDFLKANKPNQHQTKPTKMINLHQGEPKKPIGMKETPQSTSINQSKNIFNMEFDHNRTQLANTHQHQTTPIGIHHHQIQQIWINLKRLVNIEEHQPLSNKTNHQSNTD